MKLHSFNGDKFVIEISEDELLLINNSINEVCNGIHIDDWDFETRLGVSKQRGRELLKELDPLFSMKKDETE